MWILHEDGKKTSTWGVARCVPRLVNRKLNHIVEYLRLKSHYIMGLSLQDSLHTYSL